MCLMLLKTKIGELIDSLLYVYPYLFLQGIIDLVFKMETTGIQECADKFDYKIIFEKTAFQIHYIWCTHISITTPISSSLNLTAPEKKHPTFLSSRPTGVNFAFQPSVVDTLCSSRVLWSM